MSFKRLIAATAAIALMTTPVVAAAQSTAASASEVSPAGESVDEGSQLRGGFIIPLIAIIAIILGILAATRDGDDVPHSP